jgi:Icc-related predicted phosphoesterase
MQSNMHSLHFKKRTLNGINFSGIGGTVPLPFHSKICLREKRALNELRHLININSPSVLVFHTPPRWTRDEVLGKFSAGSRNLYEFTKINQPNLLICGHIHERAGITRIGKTLVVNCSISRSYAGAIIEYQRNNTPKAEMIKRNPL